MGHVKKVCNAKKSVAMNQADLLDSVCSHHLIGNRSLFTTLDTSFKSKVNIGNGECLKILDVGTVIVETVSGLKHIHSVHFVSEKNHNLLSVGQLAKNQYALLFKDEYYIVFDSCDDEMFTTGMKNNCYLMNLANSTNIAFYSELDMSETWHKRLSHLNYNSLNLVSSNELVEGLPQITKLDKLCSICQFRKHTRKSFPIVSSWKVIMKLEPVHTDISGPMKTPSLSGSKYYILFIDDITSYCWVYFMKQKSEALKNFRKLKALVENYSSTKIKSLRSDNGREYTLEEFEKTTESLRKIIVFDENLAQFNNDDDSNIEDESKVVRGARRLEEIYSRCNVAISKPTSFMEAVSDSKWKNAMDAEMSMIIKKGTWTSIDRPVEKNVIGVKWIYKTKLNLNGSINKHKARLVVQRYAQVSDQIKVKITLKNARQLQFCTRQYVDWRVPALEKNPVLGNVLMQYMAKNDAIIQSQVASLRNLETQMSQLINDIKNRPQKTLPNDTKPNPRREEYGKHLDEVIGKNVVDDGDKVDQENTSNKQSQDEKVKQKEEVSTPPQVKPYTPFIPFLNTVDELPKEVLLLYFLPCVHNSVTVLVLLVVGLRTMSASLKLENIYASLTVAISEFLKCSLALQRRVHGMAGSAHFSESVKRG
ncbi:Uncharacterized protein TCM_035607 [Theobroma cacao]|uniref:Integrase catalytic domain-containing protein n=1 Tax=Theobroma cacao TaxID=3641 RepID=A0A061FIL5_THECC|nr:Uncharacterized protein TCM_035607 [Theobroma cacao]